MPTFTEEAEVYLRLGKAFTDLVADEEQARALTKANLVVQYQFRKPESTITVKLLRDEAPEVQFGPTTWRTEVVYAMEADTAHRFFLGEMNVSVALSRGDIRASGPLKKILEVVPTIPPLVPLYREVADASPAELAAAAGAQADEDAPAEQAPVGEAHEEAPAGEEPQASAEDAPPAEAGDAPAEEPAADAAPEAEAEG